MRIPFDTMPECDGQTDGFAIAVSRSAWYADARCESVRNPHGL